MQKKSKGSHDFVQVGRIVGAFGLRGQLKIETLTNIEDRFEIGQTLYLKGEPKKIVDSRIHKNRYLIKLEGITKIDQAELLQWEGLYVPKDDRPELNQDEFMLEDLIGLTVKDESGQIIGKVDEVMAYPAHDILVVGELMIPAVKEFVLNIDLDSKELTVRLIEGL